MTFRSGPLWRTAYEVDFTTLGNQDLKAAGDGNKTIDGNVWLLGNSANAASINVTNGTGIVFVANAANTGYYEGANVRSAPNLTLPIQTIAPLYDITVNVIRVLVRMTLTNADANTEGGKLFMEYVATPKDQNFSVAKAFSAGALGLYSHSNNDPTYETAYAFNNASNTDDILSVEFWPQKGVRFHTGLYVAGERMRLQNQRGALFQNTAALPSGLPPIRKPADVRLGICQITNNGTAALTTTFTHMRVDVHDQQPAL